MNDYIDIVFDGPPAHESGRFVEVEDPSGKSISVGEWVSRPNDPEGWAVLRIPYRTKHECITFSGITGEFFCIDCGKEMNP